MLRQEKNLLVLLIILILTVILDINYIKLIVRNLGISCLNKMLLNNS